MKAHKALLVSRCHQILAESQSPLADGSGSSVMKRLVAYFSGTPSPSTSSCLKCVDPVVPCLHQNLSILLCQLKSFAVMLSLSSCELTLPSIVI